VRVLNFLRRPLVAIDVGTAATRVSFGPGRVLERPSVVREDVQGSVVVRPAMRFGVVADISGVAGVVHSLLAQRRRPWRQRPGAIVCAPTDVSAPERDSLIEAVAEGGASVVTVVPEPLAAAVGAGVDIAADYATALVDIGEGVTDFAVFRNGTIVRSSARRVGCGTLRAAVQEWLELRHGLEPLPDEAIDAVVRSYCGAGTGSSATPLTRDDLEMLLEPVLEEIASFLAAAVRELPDAMAAEVIESGIHVTGGGAHLERLIRRIETGIGLPLTASPEPRLAVIHGATKMLGNERLLRDMQP
jgi:rod shape-determining protein MreB and related proteins